MADKNAAGQQGQEIRSLAGLENLRPAAQKPAETTNEQSGGTASETGQVSNNTTQQTNQE
jgi:hypothetical protein